MALAVSSFQLESIVHFRPRVAIILNVGGLHLDRHKDIHETIRIKSRVFMNQGAEDFLILNHDDALLPPLADKHWGETLFVSSRTVQDRGAWIRDKCIWMASTNGLQNLGLASCAYPENLLSAILAASLLGISSDNIRMALEAMRAARQD
jgi:UDP-N-acetylmuramoylalanine--D-glutamate ligase